MDSTFHYKRGLNFVFIVLALRPGLVWELLPPGGVLAKTTYERVGGVIL